MMQWADDIRAIHMTITQLALTMQAGVIQRVEITFVFIERDIPLIDENGGAFAFL